MRIARVLPALLIASLLSSLSYAATDRIAGAIDSSQVVTLKGNVHGLAKPEFDLGRADGSRMLYSVTISFRPSPAQQKDLDLFLAQLQDPTSSNYHKFLTPAQYGSRFGLSQNDINKIVAWLQAQGFHNISVANGHNEISFDGTIAHVEVVFHTEMHNYVVNGEMHLANATEPSVPAALAGAAVIGFRHLQDFAPKPRVQVRPNFTSYLSGNHFLTPADFATIYNVDGLYNASTPITGTGQKIAIVGQSTVNPTDLSNFRSAAGLPAKATTLTLIEGTATRCSGDEGESDLDLEWSGGVAKDASIIFLYAGLRAGDSCTNRFDNVWDALGYAVTNNVAPFISTSYGFCEAGLGSAFAGVNGTLETWAKQGQTQGQTIVAASGDSGAADCDGAVASATKGLAVDSPAAIPEVTGAGGNEFTGDTPTCSSSNPCPPGGDPPYWSAAGTTTDTLSSALEYIPEEGWNDTAADGRLAGSGGGASIYFAKPTWQIGTGVPADSKRDVPDISLSASANHDGYLFCSEDGPNNTIVSTCTVGFRTGSGPSSTLTVVGGTSAVAPTFSAIMALVNQYVGNSGATGLAPINPTLYTLAGSHPAAFHDVATGNNIVPCTNGTPNCSTGTMGFSAGVGYDQVTGLGSVDAFALAQAWPTNKSATTTTLVAAPTTANPGGSVTLTATVSPSTATGTVTFFAGTTSLGTGTLTSGVATLNTTTLTPGANSLTATYGGDSSNASSTSTPATTVTVTDFSVAVNPTSSTVVAGHTTSSIQVTVGAINGFTGSVALSCGSSAPAGVFACNFNPTTVNPTTGNPALATLTVTTLANAPSSISVPVTGTSGGVAHAATLTLTVSGTDQSFTIAPQNTNYQVAQGQSVTAILNLTAANGFDVTKTPITYTCTDPASESLCSGPSGPTTTTTPSFTISTTAPTGKLERPFGRSTQIFYAALLPGLLGIMFTAGSRKRSLRGMRLLGLIMVLGFSTLWLGSCGGSNSSSNKNPGTPPGAYSVTVNATTGGTNPVTATTTINLQVTP